MKHDMIAAPLAAALSAKGYESLTPVQEAVLADEVAGDLLVSAQTGSGKTVAFGLAIAQDILGGSDHLAPAEAPLGLVIAPTRELALQVARELSWLYGPAGAQITTCVGGMDFRTERRGLDRGAHLVVGTPGRLRDHIERNSLDLSQLRAAVLDEADEMLDLGFREDLEFILQSAPEDRRTLMFSATVPRDIEQLAREFQRDAKRIVAQGEARQHGDIEYRAMTIAARDRDAAIFNLLRLHEAQTSIIFCKTRANVSHLLARMANRGFRAVALSGELSQQERTHALQSLRDGRSQICVATDVAARGIDLPGLELVIHADLPTNSETLLHRSGRTGRAGSKGTSVMLVMPSERKKAQSLLHRAQLKAEWGPAPSADEVRARDDERMLEQMALQSDQNDEPELAAELLKEFGAERVAAAFIQMWRAGRPVPEELTVLSDAPPAAPRPKAEFGEAVWFQLSVGYNGRAEPRWLLPKICEAGGITRDAIGAIRVRTDETYVQIDAKQADRFGSEIELEPGLEMTRLSSPPDLERGPRPEGRPAPRRDGPARGPRVGKPSRGADSSDGYAPKPKAPAKPRTKPAYDPAQPEQDGAKARKKPRWTPDERAAKSSSDKPAAKFGGPKAGKWGERKPKSAKPGGAPFKGGKPKGGKSPR